MDRYAMWLSTRVLTAISDHVQPDRQDAEMLRTFAASDEERALPLDELACVVIGRERKLQNCVVPKVGTGFGR